MTPGPSSRRRLLALLLWLPAAAGSAALFAAGAALAAWLDLTAGEADGLQDALLIDLTEMPPVEIPPVEALAALPEVAPEPQPAPEPEPAPKPETPEPETPEPPAQPEPAPVAAPEPAPVPAPSAKVQPPPKPAPKPAAKPKAPPKAKAAPKPASKPPSKPSAKPAKPNPGSEVTLSTKPKGSPAAVAKWKQKVQGQLASHIKRKRLAQTKGSLALTFTIDGSGAITATTLARSSGNPDLDAAVLAHARKKASVTAPPNGRSTTLNLPLRF